MYNEGEKTVKCYSNDGVAIGMVLLVTNVIGPFGSVRRKFEAGSRVVLDDAEPIDVYVEHKAIGNRIPTN